LILIKIAIPKGLIMTKRYIKPENTETEDDVVARKLIEILMDATEEFINNLKPEHVPFTPQQFNGIYNACMNYFNYTIDSLLHCVSGQKDKVHFIKGTDSGFHIMINQMLDSIGESETKH